MMVQAPFVVMEILNLCVQVDPGVFGQRAEVCESMISVNWKDIGVEPGGVNEEVLIM